MKGRSSILSRLDQTGVPFLLARLVVGGTMLYMGISKVVAPPVPFLKQIKLYDIIPLQPPHIINAMTVSLPWIEIACGIALVLGIWVRGAALTGLGMLAVFTTAIYLRTSDIYSAGQQSFCSIRFACGCGTATDEVNACFKMLQNTGLIVASAIALFSRSRRFCLGGILRTPAPVSEPVLSPQA